MPHAVSRRDKWFQKMFYKMDKIRLHLCSEDWPTHGSFGLLPDKKVTINFIYLVKYKKANEIKNSVNVFLKENQWKSWIFACLSS